MKTAVAVPAYGRDYASLKTLMEDWRSRKDFLLTTPTGYGSGYFNLGDVPILKQDGYSHVQFRYRGMTRVHIIKL